MLPRWKQNSNWRTLLNNCIYPLLGLLLVLVVLLSIAILLSGCGVPVDSNGLPVLTDQTPYIQIFEDREHDTICHIYPSVNMVCREYDYAAHE